MTAGQEDLLGFGGQRGQRGLGGSRGVGGGVAEDLLDVPIPGHDVVANGGGEEDRRLARGHDGERVGEELG